MKRVVTAFLVAPIAPLLPFFVSSMGIFIIGIGAPVAYATALVGGVPLYMVLKKYPHLQRGRTCVLVAGALGAVVGMCLPVILTGAMHTEASAASIDLLVYGVAGALYGAVSGLVFWIIMKPSIIKHPDEITPHV